MELSKEYFRQLIRKSPYIIYHINLTHDTTAEDVASVVAKMDPDAIRSLRYAINDILGENIGGEMDETKDITYYMVVDNDLGNIEDDVERMIRHYTDDWRVRAFIGDSGSFYDCNGWPGDNEHGYGIFVPYPGGPLQVVFNNSDYDLQIESDEFSHLKGLIKEYDKNIRYDGECVWAHKM